MALLVIIGSLGVGLLFLLDSPPAGRPPSNASPEHTNPETDATDALGAPLGGSWRALRERFDEPATLVGFELGVGVFGEPARIVTRRLKPLSGDRLRWAKPRADGPVDGTVVFTFGDGTVADLWTVDVSDGEERMIARRPSNVVAVEFDSGRNKIYTIEAVRPVVELQVVATDLVGGTSAIFATLPFTVGDDVTVDTEFDAKSGRLLVLLCAVACRLVGIDVEGRTITWERPSDAKLLTGSVGGLVGAMRACGIPCATEMIDPMSGEGTIVGETCEVATIGVRQLAPVMVTDSAGRSCRGRGDPATVFIHQADLSEPVSSREVPKGDAIVIDGQESGYEVDDNWVVLGPGGSLVSLLDDASAVTLMNLDTGAFAHPAQ